jgi:hypothetical protein
MVPNGRRACVDHWSGVAASGAAFGNEAPRTRTSSRELFNDFRAWHEAEEGRPTNVSQRTVIERLKAQKLPGTRHIGSNGFRGFESLLLAEPTEAMKRTRAYIGTLPLGSIGRMAD